MRKTVDKVEANLDGKQPVRVKLMSDGNLILEIPTTGQQWAVSGHRSGRRGGTHVQLRNTGGAVTAVASNFMREVSEEEQALHDALGEGDDEDREGRIIV